MFHDALVAGTDGAAEGNCQSAEAGGAEDRAVVALGALELRKQNSMYKLQTITYSTQEASA